MLNIPWEFTLALHQQIQNVMQGKMIYPDLLHNWLYRTSSIFLVRHAKNNQLLYDDTESLSIDWLNQNIQAVYLIPQHQISPQISQYQHEYLEFSNQNQAIIVARFTHEWRCLLPCQEKTHQSVSAPKNIDPRDYCGTSSSQNATEVYQLFTLMTLTSEQIDRIKRFQTNIQWLDYTKQFNADVYTQDYPYLPAPLKLRKNLYWMRHNYAAFLEPSPQHYNLAFSLLEDLHDVLINITGYMHPRNESSDFMSWSEEQRTQFENYHLKLKNIHTELLCHVANHYQTAFYEENELKQVLKKHNITYQYSDDPSDDQLLDHPVLSEPLNEDDEPISLAKSVLFSAVFLSVIGCIFYAIFWLSEKFAFVNWLLVVFGVISFLVIIARK